MSRSSKWKREYNDSLKVLSGRELWDRFLEQSIEEGGREREKYWMTRGEIEKRLEAAKFFTTGYSKKQREGKESCWLCGSEYPRMDLLVDYELYCKECRD